MAFTSGADDATEALIAQMMAEDFGEDFSQHMYDPIGSHAGDYEEPLTSYERQCIEHPDMEDGEGGWNSPTPKIQPSEAPLELPEDSNWDSGINSDPCIESTPAFNITKSNGSDEDKDGEGGISIGEPSHHLHDPIHYHSSDISTIQSPRHVSIPTSELLSPTLDPERNTSDPLPTSLDNPPSFTDQTPDLPQKPNSPMPRTQPSPRLSPVLGPITIPTNEQFLDFVRRRRDEIDYSASKGKGKAPVSDPVDRSDIDISSVKDKGKARVPYLSELFDVPNDDYEDGNIHSSNNKSNSRNDWDEDDEAYNDENENEDEDEAGIRFLRIPFPGIGMSRKAQQILDMEDAAVVEIRVGEEETLESILREIREGEEMRRKGWARLGEGEGEGVGVGCI